MPRASSPVDERLWRRVREAPDGCWIWLGAATSAGYGALKVDGRQELAHRMAYRLVVGAIRAGYEIDHTCGNTRCVNPGHLEQVTHRENIRRGRFPAHGAYARERGVCKRGHALIHRERVSPPERVLAVSQVQVGEPNDREDGNAMSVELTEVSVPDLVTGVEGGGPEAGAMRAELERRLTDDPDNSAVAKALEGLGPDAGMDDDAAQTGGGGATEARSQGEQTWLVQSGYTTTVDGEERQAWLDVGEITVPPRTKRKTIVEKALAAFPGAVPDKEESEVPFRVLDADSAAGIPVRWEVPPAPEPELKIG